MNEEKQDLKFNIYNPVITYDHREAYDQIVSQLQEIFPICNQGKCKALEVSDDPQKQKQINDLMEKVEYFSQSLIGITKKFFDQLYRAKEESSKANAQSTAIAKIDMIERNLLERTCDVRWWALEKAFWDCIECADENRNLIQAHLDSGVLKDLDGPEQWDAHLQVIQDSFGEKINGVVNPHRLAQVKDVLQKMMHHTESQNQDDVSTVLDEILGSLTALQPKVEMACRRLEDIRNSYTLYRDLVFTDEEGIVIANSNEDRREEVLGLDVSEEAWCKSGFATKDGTEYAVTDLGTYAVEKEESLVYSTALRAEGEEHGVAIDCMGVFFDFQGEAQLILNEYLPVDENGDCEEGWYSFFTDQKGRIICSNDELVNPTGSMCTLPRRHTALKEPGETVVSSLINRGTKSLIVSHKTPGFDEYEGIGWVSHFILPESAMFERTVDEADYKISSQELMGSRLIPKANQQTYKEIQRNKGDIQLISINGIVLATDLGKAGSSFIPIFDKITSTGNSTTGRMEGLLAEMSSDMLKQNLTAVEYMAKRAIDLIDRNLFERAADVRWWSSDHAFWEALEKPSQEKFDEASRRLGIINNSYTMYRDLVLADPTRKIVANSKTDDYDHLAKINVGGQSWFKESINATASVQFSVLDAGNNELEQEGTSLIYSSGILKEGAREGTSVGALGIFFDWDEVAVPILEGCLPRIHGDVISGSAAFYLNSNDVVIGTTDPEKFPIGEKVELPEKSRGLASGESTSGLLTLDEVRYVLGSSRTHGYREYQGLNWTAHVVRPID